MCLRDDLSMDDFSKHYRCNQFREYKFSEVEKQGEAIMSRSNKSDISGQPKKKNSLSVIVGREIMHFENQMKIKAEGSTTQALAPQKKRIYKKYCGDDALDFYMSLQIETIRF